MRKWKDRLRKDNKVLKEETKKLRELTEKLKDDVEQVKKRETSALAEVKRLKERYEDTWRDKAVLAEQISVSFSLLCCSLFLLILAYRVQQPYLSISCSTSPHSSPETTTTERFSISAWFPNASKKT